MRIQEFVKQCGNRPALLNLKAMDDMPDEMERQSYTVIHGVAVIQIVGLLGEDPYCDTTYSQICGDLMAAESDDGVTRTLLLVNSPGGFTDGAFECAAAIAAAKKPVYAVAAPIAYSAAFLLASQAQRVTVPAVSGGVGSVGVYCAHVDYSVLLEKEGIKVTLLSAGEGKVAGNPYEPLTPEVAKSMQTEIDRLYGEFVGAVARGRKMSPEVVTALGARCYDGSQAAIAAGFADDAGDFASVILALAKTAGANGFSARAGEKGKAKMDQAEVDRMAGEARAAGFADAQEIADLCLLAGQPGKIAGFLQEKKKVADVRTALLAARAAGAGGELDLGITPGADAEGKGKGGAKGFGAAEGWGSVLQKLGLKKKEVV